jgi:hypothetical protein
MTRRHRMFWLRLAISSVWGIQWPRIFNRCPLRYPVKLSDEKNFGRAAAFNLYLPMPFNKRARVEIENQGKHPYLQYFYIDYEWRRRLFDPSEILYFQAHWRRENPTNGWAPSNMQTNSLETKVPNLNRKDTYTILETTGAGNIHWLQSLRSSFPRHMVGRRR